MLRITPYLGFDGNCAEAFRLDERALGGTIEVLTTYGDTPMKEQMPPDTHGRVVHVRLAVNGDWLMGGDAPPGQYTKPASITVNVQVDRVAEAERIYRELSEGGTVEMEMQQTFWAARFAMFRDRFGTPWMINCEKDA
jgi:PhnB protein